MIFSKINTRKGVFQCFRNITIFVEEYNGIDTFEGIYIKEKLDDSSNKIIIQGVNNSKPIRYSFKLLDGKITNIDKKGTLILGSKKRYTISQN